MITPNIVKGDSVGKILDRALDAGAGLLRLTPTWVQRSFLHPGKRIKLHPDDWYAYGAHRGGIDERWFASTTEAANEGRVWHEGLSFCTFEGQQFTLKDAVAEAGARLIGQTMFQKYNRWPVYSKFFDNMGPIPHHMHQLHNAPALQFPNAVAHVRSRHAQRFRQFLRVQRLRRKKQQRVHLRHRSVDPPARAHFAPVKNEFLLHRT